MECYRIKRDGGVVLLETFVNIVAIVIGGSIGLMFKKGLPE